MRFGVDLEPVDRSQLPSGHKLAQNIIDILNGKTEKQLSPEEKRVLQLAKEYRQYVRETVF